MISAPRYNETNAKAELWFALLICGDKYPIISDLEFQGLITALTNQNEYIIVEEFKKILEKDPFFFNYILKIVPVQFVCGTDITQITRIVKENCSKYIKKHQSFRIKINRRKNKLINRDTLIDSVAKIIENPVDLENPDKIIRIEILDNICGISFLKKGDILRPKNRFYIFFGRLSGILDLRLPTLVDVCSSAVITKM